MSIVLYRAERRVELTRTREPYATVEELEQAWAAVVQELSAIDKSNWTMLTDLRQAVGRNDARFEEAMAKTRRQAYSGFRRSAVVVRTEVGRLQVIRHTQDDGVETRVFTDADAAKRWLAET